MTLTNRRIAATVAALCVAALWAASLMLGLGVLPAHAEDVDEHPADELTQTIDAEQTHAHGRVVISQGHLDIGPTLGGGDWKLQIHDDTTQPSVWRDPDDVVIHVSDAALLTVPDDPAFAFLGVESGAQVHVIPQAEQSGVVWTGWNTQDPAVIEQLALGATMRMLATSGPGELTVFQHSGTFGDPVVLWTTNEPLPQQTWIELGAHTHANWVFTKPGIYLVHLEVEGKLRSGETVRAQGVLRYAVGDDTDTDAAFEASFEGASGADPVSPETSDSAPIEPSGATLLPWIIVAGVIVLIGGVALTVTVRAMRVRSAVERELS